MKRFFTCFLLCITWGMVMANASLSIYDVPVTTIDGKTTTLASYKGNVMLIVNVASQCGFTPQRIIDQHLWLV